MPYEGDSTQQAAVPGITGKNTAAGIGVYGWSSHGAENTRLDVLPVRQR
jgi:hypothetical protein